MSAVTLPDTSDVLDGAQGATHGATHGEALRDDHPAAHGSAHGVVSPPVHRCLRGYALDPSLSLQLDTAPVSEVVFRVPWEELSPGPVGEYLEVVDYDPAGGCFYAPVDLDDPYLLAQNGLTPSEGTPQFHQQMAYAVASLTIQTFERALGRPALWSPGPPGRDKSPKDDSHFVQRLRIYPHALREPNAYYSPEKKALLFGYFQASDDDPGDHVPGGMVFTCLSHDIVAHETAHALLDGLHRRLNRATNPDMLAFHEAFADVVALFQHFTFPDILRHQIAKTQGDIRSHENLLAQMASQFGRATGLRGSLRDAIGRFDPATGRWEPHAPDPAEYLTTEEPHARGAILVAAVFDAFLSIYAARVADLLRLSTGGTGVLPAGAVHPDLVNRLSAEASKAAGHVLAMCVRALDYCPPVDLTFGEYLRALVTADIDIVPDDDRHYRVAFVEAFRRRGIYPRDVRTLSVDSLRWRSPQTDERQPSHRLGELVERARAFADRQQYARDRRDIFFQERAARVAIHEWLAKHFRSGRAGRQDAAFLGLAPARPFEVHSAHFASRVGPDGDLRLQMIVQLTQQTRPSAAERRDGGAPSEGGSTVVANLKDPSISYCVRKSVDSVTRRERERDFLARFGARTLRCTYFGTCEPGDAREPFALLHRGAL